MDITEYKIRPVRRAISSSFFGRGETYSRHTGFLLPMRRFGVSETCPYLEVSCENTSFR